MWLAYSDALRHQRFDIDVHTRRESGAVDEEPVLSMAKKAFCASCRKDLAHRRVIGYDREYGACKFRNSSGVGGRFTT
jgi:hypothetical protein